MAMPGCPAKRAPASLPRPVTTLSTPAGKPAVSAMRARLRVLKEASSDGLITTEHPAANAGATFHAAFTNGKFQGTINPATPAGS
ncbi:hypothetical protein D3C87_1864400 [compost metagenome]